MSNLTALYQQLISQHPQPVQPSLLLNLEHAGYQIFSNSRSLLDNLADYFGSLCCWQTQPEQTHAYRKIYLWHTPEAAKLIASTQWQDWTREAGKSGRKDAIFDLEFAHGSLRLLHKVKTDMLFVQPGTLNQQDQLMAFGPAKQHPNQMINFILTQYLNQHLRANWLLAHAAGLQIKGRGVAIAGLSGGGKSTLMLHLLEQGEHFISNDRLLFKADDKGQMQMRGIPKQPRINPGTIVHNPRLHSLISAEQRQAFLALPSATLRALEQKFDAPVEQLFWPDCYQNAAKLDYLIILNWQANSSSATRIQTTNFIQSPHLLAALMKSPGPFYCDSAGRFLANGQIPDSETYQQSLASIPVLELNGKIDFGVAKQLLLEQLG